ncbi:MAG: hypothetical protein JW841_14765 [Deltaproteobacteria bacterium]|nr:hypothetical protein [Deltaproteobacteria bacterium]
MQNYKGFSQIALLLSLSLSLFLITCGDEGIKSASLKTQSSSTTTPQCPDNLCNGDETCSTCPHDCGSCDSACASLAPICAQCPSEGQLPYLIKSVCQAAVTVGDPASCQNLLDDDDIKQYCMQ